MAYVLHDGMIPNRMKGIVFQCRLLRHRLLLHNDHFSEVASEIICRTIVTTISASMLSSRTVSALFDQNMALTRRVLPAIQVQSNLLDFNDRKNPNITSYCNVLSLILYQITNH